MNNSKAFDLRQTWKTSLFHTLQAINLTWMYKLKANVDRLVGHGFKDPNT